MNERITKLRARAFVLTNANTWYRIDLDANVSRLKVQPRGAHDILLRFDTPPGAAAAAATAVTEADLANASAWTLPRVAGQLIEDGLTGLSQRVVYCATADAGTIVEVLVGY